MANKWTQGRGVLKFNGTDFSSEINNCLFHFVRQRNEIPQTFGSDTKDVEFGAVTRELTLNFLNPISADSFHEQLREAIEDDGEVTFDVLLANASAGNDNPRRTGTIIVTSLGAGGEVGGLRSQSRTYRIKPGTYSKTTV